MTTKTLKTPKALETFLNSQPFIGNLEGARQGGWAPEAFFVNAEGKPLGIAAMLEGTNRQDQFTQHIERMLSEGSKLADAAFIVLKQEVWTSTDPKVRPSADPKRESAILVTAWKVEDKKLVFLPHVHNLYSLAAAAGK